MKRTLEILGRWLYWLIYLLMALMLLLSLASLASQLLHKDKPLPGILGYSQLVVVSGSMQPAIYPGDLLVIREQAGYQPGDIVTFIDGQSLVTHRLLGMKDGRLLTRGDANNTDDTPVSPEKVLGRMVLRVPVLGRLVLFLQSNLGRLALTSLLILLIAVPLILRGGRKQASTDKERGD